ncbi:MAG: serine--tRNA ligase [Candidatus Brocadiae bacterium]|nr:serine--tRNA ligase [Candidatus Brocadiia bacterium]
MLDMKLIRKNPELVKQAILDKREKCNLDNILELDKIKREKIVEVEELKNQSNKASKEIGHLKQSGKDASSLMEKMGELAEKIKTCDQEVTKLEAELESLLLFLPNIPREDVPKGGEEKNTVVRQWGEAKKLDFPVKPHWEIGKDLEIFELERATKLSGSGFVMYGGMGAKLERALINFMIDTHTTQHGYKEMMVPYMVNRRTLTGTGQLPKLEEDMYSVPKDNLFLIPTSEVPLTNIYQEEVIPGENLPIYITSATPCFRREAGAHGKENRGIIRIHQFNKVELVHIVKEEDSDASLEKLLGHAETILQKLGLTYRVVLLASGDMSFSSAKTYDIELWAPGVDRWLEVSSCSNCTDFQARRANIRYKMKGGKPQFAHTLNGSGVATPRLMVAILENYQQADGHIRIPEALVPYMNGTTTI